MRDSAPRILSLIAQAQFDRLTAIMIVGLAVMLMLNEAPTILSKARQVEIFEVSRQARFSIVESYAMSGDVMNAPDATRTADPKKTRAYAFSSAGSTVVVSRLDSPKEAPVALTFRLATRPDAVPWTSLWVCDDRGLPAGWRAMDPAANTWPAATLPAQCRNGPR